MFGVKFNVLILVKFYLNVFYKDLLKVYDGYFFKLRKNLILVDRRKYIFYKVVLNILDWMVFGYRGLEFGVVYDEEYLV